MAIRATSRPAGAGACAAVALARPAVPTCTGSDATGAFVGLRSASDVLGDDIKIGGAAVCALESWAGPDARSGVGPVGR